MKISALRSVAVIGPAAALCCLLVLPKAALESTTTSAGTGDFALSTRAVSFDSLIASDANPFGIPVTNGSYGASGTVDSLGASVADAGAPYAPAVFTLPQFGNGAAQSAFGQSLPVVPKLPGYVAAQYPLEPRASQNAGGYVLTAEAGPRQALGQVSIGGQAATSSRNNVFATARAILGQDGVADVAGEAGVLALSLEGILDVFDVSSTLRVVQAPGEQPTVTGSNNFGSLNFSGLTAGLVDDKVFVLGSSSQPMSTDSLASLNDALKPAGISIAFLPQKLTYTDGTSSTGSAVTKGKTLQKVDSGALQIVITGEAPSLGAATETLTFGHVVVSTANTALPAVDAPAGAGTPAGAAGSSDPGAALPSTGVDLAGAPLAPVTGGVAVPSGTVPLGLQPAASGAASQMAALTGFGAPETTGSGAERLYLILALAALVALAGSNLIRFLAVRLALTRR